MLYYLFTPFSDGNDVFNLFRYITFQAGGAFFTALIFAFLFGRPLINKLRVMGGAQPIYEDAPESHQTKAGTPTMGGVLILGALVVSTLLWARLSNPFVLSVLAITLDFGLIGFADDFKKVTKSDNARLSGKLRLVLGFAIALAASWYMVANQPEDLQNAIAMPILKTRCCRRASSSYHSPCW